MLNPNKSEALEQDQKAILVPHISVAALRILDVAAVRDSWAAASEATQRPAADYRNRQGAGKNRRAAKVLDQALPWMWRPESRR